MTPGPGRYDGPGSGPVTIAVPPAEGNPSNAGAGNAANTKTVTIIDGKTGARQDVVIPAEGKPAAGPDGQSPDQKFVEMTPHGPIPKLRPTACVRRKPLRSP